MSWHAARRYAGFVDEKGKAMAGIDDDEARESREGKREVLSNTWHKALKNV